MKTEKQKAPGINLLILFTITSMLFIHSPSIAGTKKRTENQGQVSVQANANKPNTSSQTEPGIKKCKKTTVLRWDPEGNCWETWRQPIENNTSSEKEASGKAYTKIKIWNCEINNWEPYTRN